VHGNPGTIGTGVVLMERSSVLTKMMDEGGEEKVNDN
jgi:hypothetical protein